MKREVYFHTFSGNYGYFYMMLKVDIRVVFLKYNCNMESETVSVKFLYGYIKNSLVYFVLWMDHLPMYDFLTSCIFHLENVGLVSYAACQMLKHFIMQYKKKISSDKSSKFWKAVMLTVNNVRFFKILIFVWNFRFYHRQEILPMCFIWC